MNNFITTNKTVKRLATLLLSLTLFLTLSAQQNNLVFKSLSVNDGLSQSTVYKIFQDNKGYMWFGTRGGGLNKYDGYTFTIYKNDLDDSCSISGNVILEIFEDSNENFWIGTRGEGLNNFNAETECYKHYFHDSVDKNSIPSNVVNKVFEDPNGRIWVGTEEGLCYYNKETDNFTRINNSIDESSLGQILALQNGSENNLWVGTKDLGIYLIDIETNKTIKHFKNDPNDPNSISNDNIVALIVDSKGYLWAGSRYKGISRLEDLRSGRFTNIRYNPENPSGLSNDIIRTIHEAKDGSIWFGTKNGIDILTPDQREFRNPRFKHVRTIENDPKSISQNSIYSFFEDYNGDYWIGTWSGGVNYLDNGEQKFEHFKQIPNSTNSLSNNNVSCFTKNNLGVWIGTEGGGLNLFNHNSGKFKYYKADVDNPNSLPIDHIMSLLTDKNGNLWVGTYEGLCLYNKNSDDFTLFLEGSAIYSITEGVDDELWVATAVDLYKLNKSTKEYELYVSNPENPKALSYYVVNKVYKDKNNNIWAGTQKGLNLYNRKSNDFTQFTANRKIKGTLSNQHVTSICEDLNGKLWVSTFDGLNMFDENTQTFITYNNKDGFPDNFFNNIIVDRQGFLWITTSKGLTKFAPNTDKPIGENGEFVRGEVIRNYEKGDGLQGNEFSTNASYLTDLGELYLGGANGFNIFEPEFIKDNPRIPKVVITNFMVQNKKAEIGAENSPLSKHISYTQSIKLNHKQTAITFNFVAFNFTSPEKNQYAYMMEGFDKDWIYIGNKREASYTNLPKGKYVFRVKASNNDGVWNQEGTSIKINVRPPWWKTTIFYILLILIISGGIYVVVKGREKQIKADREHLQNELDKGKKEIEEQRKKVEEHEKYLEQKAEEEKAAKWHSKGFIQLTNIISEKRHNLQELANTIIFEIVEYIEVQMGAIYFEKNEELKLMGGYALDDKRLNETEINVGEGLVGTCFKKKETMIIDNLPSEYAKLDSGLGDTNLTHLVLIPIIYEESIEGVIEIVSFEELPAYKVELIETVSKNLGAALINEKANAKIQEMLEEAGSQKETLFAHEEELRQNIEEMAATQEESSKREEELLKRIEELEKKGAANK